jgi:uncharacterized protein YdeI (BOF family)
MQKIFAVTVISLLATGAFAKGHNQSNTEVPGADTGTETVASSQSLGGIKGNRPDDKGPTDSPAIANAGR